MEVQENFFDVEATFTTPDTELVILVLDGSGSMTESDKNSGLSKAQAIEEHILNPDSETGLIARLQGSVRADSTQVAIVTFDHRVEVVIPTTPVRDVELGQLKLDLVQRHGGRTAMGLALRQAYELGEQFLSIADAANYNYVSILLMSDGQNNEGPLPATVSQDLQSLNSRQLGGRPQIVVAAAAYGDNADVAQLQATATSVADEPDRFYKRVDSGEELRNFFLKSTLTAGN